MRGDIDDLKRGLAERALSVCEMLLPGGRVEGREFVFDPGHGKIKVVVKGGKAGVWSHFGGDDAGGDLIDLWMHRRGVKLVEALDQVREYLGVERPQYHTKPRREYTRPPKPACARPTSRVRDYLVEERNINPETLDLYKIGERGDVIVFPFLTPEGELVLAKERQAVDGAKPKPTTAGCEPILFGWQAIPENAREVTITEGEIDALSMCDYGYPALSVPFGGGKGAKQQWIENEYDRLSRFDTIYLAMDSDTEGQLAVEEIAGRLGRHRVRVVALPLKDANECAKDGRSKAEIDACFEASKTMDPECLRLPTEYADNVVELFWPAHEDAVGYPLPFSGGGNVRFRPGEVTVWSGAAGSGKSQLLSYCAVSWIAAGARVCMASLEMHPAQTLKRMVKQAGNTDRPTEDYIRASIDWMSDGLLLFDLVGKAKIDAMLDAFDYARAKYGCDTFVIDSLMRLGLMTDDYNGQEQLMFRIVDWAVTNNVHVHLVAHARKADQRSNGPATTDEIKGASEIGNNAFNALIVQRNRKREEAEQDGEPDDPEEKMKWDAIMAAPGVNLAVVKQRNGDWEGRIGLWFNQSSYQYRAFNDPAHGVVYCEAQKVSPPKPPPGTETRI